MEELYNIDDFMAKYGCNPDLLKFKHKKIKGFEAETDYRIIIDLYDRRLELAPLYNEYYDKIQKNIVD